MRKRNIHIKRKTNTKKYGSKIISLLFLISTLLILSVVSCEYKEKTNTLTPSDDKSTGNHSFKEGNNESMIIECHQDNDCIHMPSCCHRRAMPCVPRYRVNEKSLQECNNIICTQECRPCTVCKCINHKCTSEIIENSCC